MTAVIILFVVLISSWAWLIYEFKHSQSITIEEEAAMDDALNAERELPTTNFEKA